LERRQICPDDQVVALQARNGLVQFDEIRKLVAQGWQDPASVAINRDLICRLHYLATVDIFDFAGAIRTGPVTIDGTSHVPPPAEEVEGHVADMLKYIADSSTATAVHLCAYVLWRCNWIHPFPNGNGRTTRGLAYLVFLLRLGYEPGGVPTFIDMISDDKQPYYLALDDADAAWKTGKVDVSAMEAVVTETLARQLVKVISDASGR
jgi:fido (protein-threonine AMPylation protein)